MSRVVLYGRPHCHLCDEARAGILALRSEGLEFELDEVDIDADEGLLASMLERIPVIAVDGLVVSELVPDLAAVRARVGTVSA